MNRIVPVDPAVASGQAKTLLDGVKAKVGAVPNLFRARRVVDVEERLAGREAEAVRHLVLVLADDELQLVLAAARRDHEDALPPELALALDPELLDEKAQRRADRTREDYEKRHGR